MVPDAAQTYTYDIQLDVSTFTEDISTCKKAYQKAKSGLSKTVVSNADVVDSWATVSGEDAKVSGAVFLA